MLSPGPSYLSLSFIFSKWLSYFVLSSLLIFEELFWASVHHRIDNVLWYKIVPLIFHSQFILLPMALILYRLFAGFIFNFDFEEISGPVSFIRRISDISPPLSSFLYYSFIISTVRGFHFKFQF